MLCSRFIAMTLLVLLVFVCLGESAFAAGACASCGEALGNRYLKVGERAYCSRLCHHKSLPQCDVCAHVLDAEYLKTPAGSYCSRRCYLTTLPNCDVCGKALEGKYASSGDKLYCSEQCFLLTQPQCEICGKHAQHRLLINERVYCLEHGRGPRCSSCRLPFAAGSELDDGRFLCQACSGDAVLEHAHAAILYHRAQNVLHAITSWRSETLPHLVLADLPTMARLNVDAEMEQIADRRGLYRRETTTITRRSLFGSSTKVEVKRTVYILYGLNAQNFLATAVHELVHDLLAEEFPAISAAPKWVEEGLCQYIADIACQMLDLTAAATIIRNCPDPVYGDGYRWYAGKFGAANWPGIRKWLLQQKFMHLPAHAPK